MSLPAASSLVTLRRLRDRLSDLSMRNRALRLVRLPKKRAFDLAWLDRAQPGESGVALQKLLSGRAQDALLLKINSEEDESLGLHRGLVALDREVRLMEAERGAYDLAVGVGFLCGALAEGKTVQAPVLLLPRRLLLDGRGREGTRWTLRPLEDPREVRVNRTLLLALQKYMNLTMDPEALEEEASENEFSWAEPLKKRVSGPSEAPRGARRGPGGAQAAQRWGGPLRKVRTRCPRVHRGAMAVEPTSRRLTACPPDFHSSSPNLKFRSSTCAGYSPLWRPTGRASR
jgi:hypothetical protein